MSGLPPLHLGSRRDRLGAALADAGLDVLVVTDPSSIRWLTGFTGSNGLVVARGDRLLLVTDGRYADQAPAQLEAAGVSADVEITVDLFAVAAAATAVGERVGAEADHLTWARQRRLADALPTDLLPTDGVIGALRAVKDAAEVARLRHAAGLADQALAAARPLLGSGASEREVAGFLDAEMRRLGAVGPAYETIVASGPNSALPHARPTDRLIGEGDLVVVDVGALVDGYHSDMTRSFVVGAPDDQQRRMLEAVAAAQAAGVAAVAAGVAARTIDTVCRGVLADEGLAEAFSHGTGHGIGLEIHEAPWLNARTDDQLDAGMVHTVEPGVYLAGIGGVRWEDSVVVTATGADVLTHSPKDPLVAPA